MFINILYLLKKNEVMIDYVLEDNLLTPKEPNDRRARVVNVQSRSESDHV
jgi:hypothetical protein